MTSSLNSPLSTLNHSVVRNFSFVYIALERLCPEGSHGQFVQRISCGKLSPNFRKNQDFLDLLAAAEICIECVRRENGGGALNMEEVGGGEPNFRN